MTEGDAGLPTLIGHSHSEPIFAAARAAGIALEGFNFWTAPQPAMNADRSAFHPEIAARLSHGTVVSVVGGAVHNILALVQHPCPFDFELPWRPDLPAAPGANLLPYSAVRDMVAHHLQEYLDIIGLVRRTASGAVFHVEAPPPLEDGERVLADVPWMFFPNLTRTVSPAPLRYKMWRLASRLTDDYCVARAVTPLPHPPASVDERGYLRPEYYADAMHVNERYGALVVDQLMALDPVRAMA